MKPIKDYFTSFNVWISEGFRHANQRARDLWMRYVGLSRAYREVFDVQKSAVRTVLKDLGDECYENGSTFHTDPIEMARRCAKREVILKIKTMAQLTTEELYPILKERLRDANRN